MGIHSRYIEKTDTDSLSVEEMREEELKAGKAWGIQIFDRALRTGLQSAIAWFAVAQADNLVLNESTALTLLSVVLASMTFSVLTGLVSAPDFNNSWWFQILERAVKTFSQNVIAGWGVTAVAASTVGFPMNFTMLLSAAGVATIASLTMSISTTNMGNPDTVDIFGPRQ